jgi:hypothetical protein
MKKRKGIRINFTNRWLYTLIAILILAVIGVGVYAAVDTTKAWHPVSQIDFSGIAANSIPGSAIQVSSLAKVASACCADSAKGGTLNGYCTMTYVWKDKVGGTFYSSSCSTPTPPATCGSSGTFCACPSGYNRLSMTPGLGLPASNDSSRRPRSYFIFSCVKT